MRKNFFTGKNLLKNLLVRSIYSVPKKLIFIPFGIEGIKYKGKKGV